MRVQPVVLLIGAASLLAGALLSACDRRAGTRPPPSAGARPEHVAQVPLVPGRVVAHAGIVNPVGSDAQALEEGRRLYNWFNCVGCHFEGGGGIGPAFMDGEWIYGGSDAQVFDSIVSGRANGMPTFGDKLTIEQTWHLVAFVRSLDDSEPARDRSTGSGERVR